MLSPTLPSLYFPYPTPPLPPSTPLHLHPTLPSLTYQPHCPCLLSLSHWSWSDPPMLSPTLPSLYFPYPTPPLPPSTPLHLHPALPSLTYQPHCPCLLSLSRWSWSDPPMPSPTHPSLPPTPTPPPPHLTPSHLPATLSLSAVSLPLVVVWSTDALSFSSFCCLARAAALFSASL